MGIAKQRWMEALEAEGKNAQWECPKCEGQNDSDFEIPEINFTSDKARDYYGEDIFEIDCEYCGFHAEGTVHNSVFGLEFQITGPDNNPIHIEAIDPNDFYEPDFEEEYEDWYWEPSDNPNDEFTVAINGMRTLLKTNIEISHDGQLLNRIVFSQTITALEAYLSDTLINLVKGDKVIQKSIYEKDAELGKKKFTAKEFLDDSDLPEKYMLLHFRKKISFHNLDTANKLFKYALNQDIFVDDAHRNLMFRAIELRHDCVHRNGKTEESVKHNCFDTAYVISIIEATEQLFTKVRHMLIATKFRDLKNEEET